MHVLLIIWNDVLQIYASFFCRVNEPSYIKHIKLDILTAIADETNAYDIATELTEYVNDIDEQLARAAVRAVGRISLEVPSMSMMQEPGQPLACHATLSALHHQLCERQARIIDLLYWHYVVLAGACSL